MFYVSNFVLISHADYILHGFIRQNSGSAGRCHWGLATESDGLVYLFYPVQMYVVYISQYDANMKLATFCLLCSILVMCMLPLNENTELLF